MDLSDINASLGIVKDSAATKASTNLASNFDDFLTLLTTQLQYQDPLNPTDTNEFTNQLVNFTNVEQSIATNQNLEALVQLQQIDQQNSQAATLINYLGKTVGSNLNVADLSGGDATWNLDFGTSASSLTYDIYDAFGNKVFTEEASGASAGAQTYSWDGTRSNGSAAANGAYYLVATGKTSGGSDVAVTYSFKGVATSIETENGQPVLKVGNVPIGITNINSVQITEEDNPSA